jgi:hypothetical protein
VIEIYLAGLAVVTFYWVADCGMDGPVNRALNAQYGSFGKHSIAISGLFMWPITIVVLVVSFVVLTFIGALLDRGSDTLARLALLMIAVGVALALAGKTGRKISWGVE